MGPSLEKQIQKEQKHQHGKFKREKISCMEEHYRGEKSAQEKAQMESEKWGGNQILDRSAQDKGWKEV